MASKMANVSPICPKCLESFPVLKMLNTCKHVFCQMCLSDHLAKLSPESVVIPCPTCRVESLLPQSGFDGLDDYTGTGDGAEVENHDLLGAVQKHQEKPAHEGSKEKLTGSATGAVTVNKSGHVGGLLAAASMRHRPRDIQQCHLIFEKAYDSRITSLANLGSKFAVSYAVNSSAGSPYQIDIFEFPGKLKHTITKHIKDLRHIASTPDGHLAVLCVPFGDKCYVSVFDPETSHWISTTYLDIIEGMYLMSFDVRACHEFVIMDGKMVRVFGQDGSVLLSTRVSERSGELACSGKFVLVAVWTRGIDAYELKENRLVRVTSSERIEYVSDVSATPDGEVTVQCERNGSCCLGRSVMCDGGFSEWSFKEIEPHSRSGGDISVKGHHVVTSIDKTVRVFAERY